MNNLTDFHFRLATSIMVYTTLKSFQSKLSPKVVSVITSVDAHGSVFRERGHLLTLFNGALPYVMVSSEKSVLLTDGRYISKARMDVKEPWEVIEWKSEETTRSVLDSFFKDHQVEVDAAYTSLNVVKNLKSWGFTVNFVPFDLPDDRGFSTSFLLPPSITGETSESKITRVLAWMKEKKRSHLFLNVLEDVAWILNLRGADVHCVPVCRLFLLLKYSPISSESVSVDLFADEKAISAETYKTLSTSLRDTTNFVVHPICNISSYLQELKDVQSLSVSPQISSLHHSFVETVCQVEESPILALRSIKNEKELEASRIAHVHDGLAVARFAYWLSTHNQELNEKTFTEWDLCKILLNFREASTLFHSLSFDTIMGSGRNASIIHYKPNEKETSNVKTGHILLVDSGAHYSCGATTDVTRTFWVPGVFSPSPLPTQIKVCTAVLEGHLRTLGVRFPKGTSGKRLDPLARCALWKLGLDYAHSTGHGVGAMLNVHEGPIGIGINGSTTPLSVGNILSIEPGAYVLPTENLPEGVGCRVESLVEVVESPFDETEYNAGQSLQFRALTCCPIDLRLIDLSKLDDNLLTLLDDYHSWVRVMLTEAALGGIELKEKHDADWDWDDRNAFVSWLNEMTKPIAYAVRNQAINRPPPMNMF